MKLSQLTTHILIRKNPEKTAVVLASPFRLDSKKKDIHSNHFLISNQNKMYESNDMGRKQKFEQNVKNYLKAMDKIQLDLVKMLEESMELNDILQETISRRAERYLEQDTQRIPREKINEV